MAVHVRKLSSLITGQVFRTKAYVGGRWVDSASGRTFPVWNPSNKQLVAEAPEMDQADAKMAVEAAADAQNAWRSKSAKERSSLVYKWYEQVVKHQEELANIITTEQGKPLADAQAEIKYGASFLEWFAQEGRRIYGDIVSPPTNDRRLLVVKQPVGVVALITPWNFPLAMVTRKAGAALAAGCTAILKPSEETPFIALALAELAHQAGIPEGVFNVVTTSSECTPDVVKTLCTHPTVRKISFTGSTAVGKILMHHATEDVKRVSLELGGNAPLIVFDSANVEVAVAGTLAGKVRCSGQTCVSPNRVLVQDQIHDQFVEEMSKALSALKVGDGFDPDVQIGPLINAEAVEKVEAHVSDARKHGGEVVTGGQKATNAGEGYFYQPTLLTGVKENMILNQEETFGPVVSVARFTEEAEGLHLANNSQHGLAGYIFSEDYRQIWRVSEALECGIVGVNVGVPTTVEAPFGGIKQSGIGVEGSKYGINEYVNTKFIGIGDLKF